MTTSPDCFDVLRLSLIPGVGPILGRRLIESLGSAGEVVRASAARLTAVKGVGPGLADRIALHRDDALSAADAEMARAETLGVRIIPFTDGAYPAILCELPDAPLVLYVRGELPAHEQLFGIAIVGSRRATAYGVEQAERFASMLAQAGLAIVSGGARGIDTAAHRAAVRVRGRSIVVMGCGLAHCYPPENAPLFEQVIGEGGALISELPLTVSPAPENFPARNRIISGLSLGTLVIEAPGASGALITARCAVEEQGREVFALPGRVDSRASEGAHELIKSGAAALVTSPSDIIDHLEAQAWHLHRGSHGARFAPVDADGASVIVGYGEVAESPTLSTLALTDRQRTIVESLSDPKSVDELCRATGLGANDIASDLTLLEIRRVVIREGGKLVLRR